MATQIDYSVDIDRPELINLCQHCRHPDCIGICDEYKNLARELRNIAPLKRRGKDFASRVNRQGYKITYTAFGEEHTLKEWSRKTGIPYTTLYNRILLRDMTLEQAIEAPLIGGVQPKLYDFHGEKLSLTQIALKLGMNRNTLRRRLERGWTFDDATGRPVEEHKGGRDDDGGGTTGA